ncbi:antitoxin [Agilicoccus flavus]|uniref:antitoxin n=1 Tax=Agilicoccus flavus TaxID=2775968 RepID=UPI001CF64ACA|nr:antitoxin [Agilicoccus flavus]
MSQFDNLAGKASELNEQHGDKIEGATDQGLEQAGNAADSRTGGKFSEQIDQAQAQGDERVGDNSQ